ncbi:hypothetical protein Cfor_11293 [Coptotermes formosanus]|uniref:Uncharacterized protein n=1 Tax=Coptotermes formosanus TaxID=36987 RepID=A0A6L2PY84_COPFO|nr:hypothetical protein Cfor_11293 [Coptotermes formosanus]
MNPSATLSTSLRSPEHLEVTCDCETDPSGAQTDPLLRQTAFLCSFVQEFIGDPLDGVTLLLDLLRTVQLSQANHQTRCPPPVLRRALLDENSCLQCLRSCLRCPDAARRLSASPAGLFTLAVCIMSNVSKSRVLALEVSHVVCRPSEGKSCHEHGGPADEGVRASRLWTRPRVRGALHSATAFRRAGAVPLSGGHAEQRRWLPGAAGGGHQVPQYANGNCAQPPEQAVFAGGVRTGGLLHQQHQEGAAFERNGGRASAGRAVALGAELRRCGDAEEQGGAGGEGQRDAGREGDAAGEAGAG